MIHIYGSKYRTKNDDFKQLMVRDSFTKTLFIFNDNEKEHNSSKAGAGNAIMRMYNSYSNIEIPRSHGIPTGVYRKGYDKLDEKTKEVIDESIDELKELLSTGNYDSIMYSIEDERSFVLGTSLFKVNREVLVYITKCLLSLGEKYFIVLNTEIIDEFIPITGDILDSIE